MGKAAQILHKVPIELEHYIEAAAEKLLSYQAAASIIRMDFPTDDYLEYAHALVRGSF